MNMLDQISILLGAYNAEKYIKEQLDSVIAQTYKNWILYIRDDASTDGTKKIVKDYTHRDKRIILVDDNLGNLGCNGNYFHLLNIIDSKYYMFCNADDYWLNNKIEISYYRMKMMEKKYGMIPIIVHTDLSITDQNLNIIYDSMWKYNNIIVERFTNFNDIGICNIVAGATTLFNKQVKDITFPIHPAAPFFDHWMALQTTKNNGIISSIHKPTVYYRQIGSNLAGIVMGKQNTILFKIMDLKKVFDINIKEAKMLKRIGWGNFFKYLIYKLKILYYTRINKSSK